VSTNDGPLLRISTRVRRQAKERARAIWNQKALRLVYQMHYQDHQFADLGDEIRRLREGKK
jgi:hypothetical protein